MASLKVTDSNGKSIVTIPGLLAPVALTGVTTSTSSNQNLVTVDSTSGCYPGMPVAIGGLPRGCFIYAIRSTTVLELWAPKWDATTGEFSVSAANANATAALTNALGYALPFSTECMLPVSFAMGTWRNTFSTTATSAADLSFSAPGLIGSLVNLTSSTTTGSPTTVTTTITPTMSSTVSDELKATPLKRHNGEFWGRYFVLSTGGILSSIIADPKLHYTYAA